MTITDLVISGVIGGIFGYFGGMLSAYVIKRSKWGR